MPEFGSFALLLALDAVRVHAGRGGAGTVAARHGCVGRLSWRQRRLQETARRAGIASFFAVSCAAFALVWAAFTNDYSVSYILHHTNRELATGVQVFSAVERAGRLAAALGLAAGAYGFVLRLRHKVDVRLSAYASTILAGCRCSFCCC